MSPAVQEAARLAQNLARNCGYAVFPCRDDKKPACVHGFKDASSDPDGIARLWRAHPGPLIGVATGRRSGQSVLDIDQKHPQAVAWWQESHPRLLPTRTFRTRSGGLHLWMQHRDGVTNTQGKIVRGVDTRGEGGYAIYWFAAGYECLDPSPPAPWPTWLLAELQPKPAPALPRAYRPRENGDDDDERRLDGVLRCLSSAREGERNGVLYWAACRCTELEMSHAQSEAELIPVARGTGLPEREIRATIKSGLGRKS